MLDRAIARAKEGDEEAYRFLYSTHIENVRGYLQSILRNEEDAEDVAQQVFMRMLSAIGRYEQRDATFLTWLLRIAHNAAIDHIRRTKPQSPLLDEEPSAARIGEAERRELVSALEKAFVELPEDHRKVLVMRHVAGLSPGEIAAEVGRTVGAVHCLHHRARRQARDALAAQGVAPVAV